MCSELRLPPGRALANDDERGPVGWMRLVRLALVDEREHRAPQSLRPADPRVTGDLANGRRDELDGGVR